MKLVLALLFFGRFLLASPLRAQTCEELFSHYDIAFYRHIAAIKITTQSQVTTFENRETGQYVTIIYDNGRNRETQHSDSFPNWQAHGVRDPDALLGPLHQDVLKKELEALAQDVPVIALNPYALDRDFASTHNLSFAIYNQSQKLVQKKETARDTEHHARALINRREKKTTTKTTSPETETIFRIGFGMIPFGWIEMMPSLDTAGSALVGLTFVGYMLHAYFAPQLRANKILDKQNLEVATETIDHALKNSSRIVLIVPYYLQNRLQKAFKQNSDYVPVK